MPSEGISVGDLLRIDFTATTIDRDGLYVVTLDDEWIGYKRFQRMPSVPSGVYCETAKMHLSAELLAKSKVVGLVKDIFHRS